MWGICPEMDTVYAINVKCNVLHYFFGPKIFIKHHIEIPSETLKYPNIISPSVLTLTDWLMVNAGQAYN